MAGARFFQQTTNDQEEKQPSGRDILNECKEIIRNINVDITSSLPDNSSRLFQITNPAPSIIRQLILDRIRTADLRPRGPIARGNKL